ncbi:ATP-binding cassette domain-containing protein [Candidimonas nitroreducens]|nr:ATP-binding cassette domain-containing protein [Candidimonas nitroreducens]
MENSKRRARAWPRGKRAAPDLAWLELAARQALETRDNVAAIPESGCANALFPARHTDTPAHGDRQLAVVQDVLARLAGCSGDNGLVAHGLLQHLLARRGGEAARIGRSEAYGLEGLNQRLSAGMGETGDAMRAGDFIGFMLNRYGPARLLGLARELAAGLPLDAASRMATGHPAAMLELQWAHSLPRDSLSHGMRAFGRWILAMLRPYWALCLLLAGGLLIQAFYAMLMPIWLHRLFDHGITPHRTDVVEQTLALLAGGFLVSACAGIAVDLGVSTLGPRALNDVRERAFDRLLALSFRHLGRYKSTTLVSRLTSDMHAIESATISIIPSMALKLVMALGALAAAVALDWHMALATVLLFGASMWAPRRLTQYAVLATHARKSTESRLTAFIKETIQMLPVIRALDISGHRREQHRTHLQALRTAARRHHLLGELTGRMTGFALSGAQMAVIALGAMLALHGTVSSGVVVAYIGLLLELGSAANGIAEQLSGLIHALSCWQRIESLLQGPIDSSTDAPALPKPVGEPISRVSLSDVSFSYAGDRLDLDGVSLETPLPRRIALVGPSGSGKSTVLNLMSRTYDAISGGIAFDGIDIRDLDSRALKSAIAMVNQDNTLFDGSIRYNIRLGRLSAGDTEVEQAARTAEIHDFILSLPQGYDTEVGEGGRLLSGGQRQRIVIARAILRDPQILLLDEATASLDAEAEVAISRTLAHIGARRTVLSVTHRLASCPAMDLICVFRNGRLAETGTHDELLQRRGTYHDLWEKQSQIEIAESGKGADITLQGLRRIPLFAATPAEDLERIQGRLRVVEVQAGSVLIEEGSRAGNFYIIARGEVESSVRTSTGAAGVMEILEIGDFFGEFALLEDVPHPTTCRARLPCLLLSISREDLQDVASLDHSSAEQSAMERAIAATLDRRLDAKLARTLEERGRGSARMPRGPAG